GLARRCKAMGLPSVKKVKVNMPHVASGHMAGGSRRSPGSTKDMFPEGMAENQVERVIKQAYSNAKRLETQESYDPNKGFQTRVFLEGNADGMRVRMWLNLNTNEIESAWPKFS